MRHAFDALTPDAVLDALDSVGLRGDGRLTALSSYENRVYQVQLEDGSAVVAKFYRPERWSDAQIQEEHDFAAELMAQRFRPSAHSNCKGQTPPGRKPCTTLAALPSASAHAVADARLSWTMARCWNGLAVFWRASTPWARPALLSPGPAWTCTVLARNPCSGCWSTTKYRWMCNRLGPRFAQTLLIW